MSEPTPLLRIREYIEQRVHLQAERVLRGLLESSYYKYSIAVACSLTDP